jgi:hypothetical protein
MPTDPRKAIFGTWRLVHSVEFGPGGEKRYPLGEDAIGCIIYTDAGVMAVQIGRRVRAPIGPMPSSITRTTWPISAGIGWIPKMLWFITSWNNHSFRVFILTI